MKFGSVLSLCLLAAACQSSKDDSNVNSNLDSHTDTTTIVSDNDTIDLSEITGMYVGYFYSQKINDEKNASYSNKITLVIETNSNGILTGHSIVAGNLRPFNGSIDANNYAEVAEPGDDKYDGTFKFNYHPEKKNIEGVWIANDTNLAVSERNYNLRKTTFSYNPDLMLTELNGDESDEYPYAHLVENQNDVGLDVEAITWDAVRINASNTILKKEDIENLYRSDLEIIRNAMYARHGYSFKNRKMRYFFDSYVDWYIPVSIDVRNELTDIERKNEELLKRYEEHANSYYDYFGR